MTIEIPALQGTYVKHGLLIDLTVNTSTYYLANTYNPITWNGNEYIALGHFMGISEIQDDIKATSNTLQLTLTGIPTESSDPDRINYIGLMLNSNIKGSRVQIRRAFFDTTTGQLLSDQVYLRFSGYISNYTLTDNVDTSGKTAINTIVAQCSSIHAVLEKRIVGRRTNDSDQKLFYPGDTGFDRVKVISNKSFDFGKPYSRPAGQDSGGTDPSYSGGGGGSSSDGGGGGSDGGGSAD
jgi:uncharacterized membrane protein YgcG